MSRFLFIFFISSFYFIQFTSSSLSTVSISETSNHTLVCALTLNSSLNCSSFPTGIQIPVNPSTSFSALVGGNGFLCALLSSSSSSISAIVCWRYSVNGGSIQYKRIYQGSTINELESGNTHISGLVGESNQLQTWQWPEFVNSNKPQNLTKIAVGDGFVCGLLVSGKAICSTDNNSRSSNNITNVPDGNYSVIAAGSRHACAITYSNDLACWGDLVGELPRGKFVSLALGENRSCGLRTNGTVVCWGLQGFCLTESLRETFFSSIEAKRNVFCGVFKSNYSLHCWGNENFDRNHLVFDEVLPGPCRTESKCPCGPLPGSGIICGGGLVVCKPCETDSLAPEISPPPPPQVGRGSSSIWSARNVAFLVLGCVGSVAFLISLCFFFFFKYCKVKGCRVHDSGPMELGQNQNRTTVPPALVKKLSHMTSMGNTTVLEEFQLPVLIEATDNFSEDRKLGAGSFGSVYYGILDDGREVAIKRAELSNTVSYSRREEDKDNAFMNELEFLSRLNHKNLVKLLGFCEEKNERVLIYEYMANGSLHDHIHKLEISPLTSWTARIKVALDAARGIEYLHMYAVPPIIHRDIKSSNILLDSTWNAKVSDFGLSLLSPSEGESHLSLNAAGTVGYMDPEYYRFQQLTAKSDVYSFSIMLLELLSGTKAIHKNENGVPRNVVDYVVPYIVQDDIHRVLDTKISPPTPYEIEAVRYVGYLAADCVTLEGRDRPSMTDIVDSLEKAFSACFVHPSSLSRSTTGSSIVVLDNL